MPCRAQEKEMVLDKLEQGLGGKKAIEQARFLVFNCKTIQQTENIHLHKYVYDRETGDTRFESRTEDEQSLTVLFNTKTNDGEVYLNNEKVDSLELIASVTHYFKEDSYWLFTPILLGSQGLKIEVEPSQLINSKRYYVVTVENPNPLFEFSKLFLDASSGSIYRWQTFDREGDKIYDFICSDNKDIGGGLKLPTKFVDYQKGVTIEYPVIAALVNIEIDKLKTQE